MAKNLAKKQATESPSVKIKKASSSEGGSRRPNAVRDRNWGVLFVSFVFVLALIATLAIMVITIGTRLDVIPAALLMVLVELWLIIELPMYSKLTFWGSVIFILSFLFFALPFVALNLFPPYNAYGIGFIIISLVCFGVLFRERRWFLERPTPTTTKATKKTN
jgi:hypothetical protein